MDMWQPEMDPMEPIIVTRDGRAVNWRTWCACKVLGAGSEALAVDLSTGDRYWACVHCRGIVRPARATP